MSIVKNINTNDIIELEDLIEYLDSLGSYPLKKDLNGVMKRLRMLCNNRHFFTDYLRGQMKDLDEFDYKQPYSSQVFLIKATKDYAIRMVIWEPQTGRVGEEIFFYEDLHDHNFDLLTIGYQGSGYSTTLYTYDYNSLNDGAAENTLLNNKKEVQLAKNTILFMEASKDVHAQYPSSEFSISLNVMQPIHDSIATQYAFDFPDPNSNIANIRDRTTYYDVESFSELLACLKCSDTKDELMKAIELETNTEKRMILYSALESFH